MIASSHLQYCAQFWGHIPLNYTRTLDLKFKINLRNQCFKGTVASV
jgi:hypothetical protein